MRTFGKMILRHLLKYHVYIEEGINECVDFSLIKSNFVAVQLFS